MTTLFVDGFDHYGSGSTTAVANMLNNVYAEVSSTAAGIGAPSWGARTGSFCYFNTDEPTGLRLVLPGSTNNFFISLGWSIDMLPLGNNEHTIVSFRDNGNTEQAKLVVESTGSLSLYNSSNTLVGSTNGPVVGASTWYHFEMQYQAAGTFELRVNEDTVMSGSFDYPDADIAQVAFVGGPDHVGTVPVQYLDDLIIRNTGGDFNNGFEGDLRVATLFPNSDSAIDGWTANPRHLFGTGILDTTINTSFLSEEASGIGCGSPSTMLLGSGDFTLETFVRVGALPTTGNTAHIAGMWDDVDGLRSYQLYLDDVTGGNVIFRCSTDGTAATITNIIDFPWAPDTDTWYHVAVSRAAGETMLFIDGVQQGLAIADTNAYFAPSAGFPGFSLGCPGIGGSSDSTGWLAGWYDETRLTVGVGRYTANFAVPVAAFPRGGSDPDWSSVVFLAGYNGALGDESSFGRAVTSIHGPTFALPDDSDGAYECVNKPTPADDTFISAPLLPATNILTQTAQPTATHTVTVGTKDGTVAAVYTWVAALTAAFQVKIGANLNTSLVNLTAAINGGPGSGTAYGTGTTANFDVTAAQLPLEQIKVTAATAGTAGNSIASTTTDSNGSWDSATLTGGTAIPGPSAFSLSRPPNNTTVIKSITLFTRQNKTDAGTCETQTALIGPGGTVLEATTSRFPTTNVTYYYDHYEVDPDTGGDITPTTVVGCKVQVNRTE